MTSPRMTIDLSPMSVPTDPRLTVSNDPVARRDVSETSCQYSGGGWAMSGSVTNSTNGPATYVLQITYTDSHSTVQDAEKTSVSPAPGVSLKWSTTWKTSQATGIVCVLDAVSRS